jgi:hypothetical protein
MRLVEKETVSYLPGYGDSAPKKTLEWICPDCDYFEEVDVEKT